MIAPVSHDTQRFTALLAERLGLHPEGLPQGQLAAVLATRLAARGCADWHAYQTLLQDPQRADAELTALAAEFAVGETYFFRGQEHWQALFQQVLPTLLAQTGGRRLRLLSAGCASGEEPYTAALLLREWRPDLLDAVEIVGLDASAPLLAKARRGEYSAWSLRSTSAVIKTKYFRQTGFRFELAEDVRRSVRFEHRNLLRDDPLFWHAGAFDVILCRNVFIYFTPPAMAETVARFSNALSAGGFLFLGHAETLRGVSRDYHLRDHDDAFYYQRCAPNEVVEPDLLFELWRDARHQTETAEFDYPADDSWFEVSQRVAARVAAIADRRPHHSPHALPSRTPEDRDTLLGQTVALVEHGDIDGAETRCRRLLALDEFDAAAHYLLALCSERAGDDADAEVRLQAAIYLDARFAMAHLQLGRLQRRRNRPAAAERHFRAALRLLPGEDGARLALLGGGLAREALLDICRGELQRRTAEG